MPSDTERSDIGATTRQSYKYQRLREKVRAAILSKELEGKLPGERELARHFKVNAKTLGKALTDLAAEGLLERTLGVGTFVKGSAPSQRGQQVMLLTAEHPSPLDYAMLALLKSRQVPADIVRADHGYSTAKLATVRQVVLTADKIANARVRDLIVRRKHVVAVDCSPGSISMHAVWIDRDRQVDLLIRDLVRHGHKKFWTWPSDYPALAQAVANSLRQVLGVETNPESLTLKDVSHLNGHSGSVIICGCNSEANKAMEALRKHQISVPGQVGLAHVGCAPDDSSISGYCVGYSELASEMLDFMDATFSAKPTTLWLSGQRVPGNTVNANGHT